MQPLNDDQRRELINTRQRFAALREASRQLRSFRGSMVWSATKGTDYLLHSYYTQDGQRKQASLGARSPQTERIKQEFEANRAVAAERVDNLKQVMKRQSAINRVLGLGRVPTLPARIIRALDDAGLLGQGLRIVGTHALYAYEAAAGVVLDASILTTEDVDLLFDARVGIRFAVDEALSTESLMRLLAKVDRSFARAPQSYRAVNRDGYLVDLIKPMRSAPWAKERDRIGHDDDDLEAVAIEGLVWLENSPAFEAIAVDESGTPVRLVACDPRVFAAHKLWLSRQPVRDPLKRRRDEHQARAVARLTSEHLLHLPYESGELKMLPMPVFEAAKALFV